MGGKTKILMTTDSLGGVWTFSFQLCKALGKYGVEVHLVVLGALPSEEQEEEISSLHNVLLYKSNFKLEWMQDPWEDVEQTYKWLNGIYQTVQPDLIHQNNFLIADEQWNCPKITVFHSCVNTWWKAVKGKAAPAEWERYHNLVRKSLQTSDVVVAPGEAILEKAREEHQFSSASKVIYNGIELEKSGTGKKENFIFSTGRIWDEAKNLKVLSEIANELPWPVYIAGENKDPDSEEQKELKNVHFLGKLSAGEVKKWMQRAAIFVSPTKYEPFGLAILEAADAGCALVLSDLETLREIWEESAVYFDPDNAAELKQKILLMTQNSKQTQESSEKAKRRAENFSAERMAENYFELYQKLIETKTDKKLVNL